MTKLSRAAAVLVLLPLLAPFPPSALSQGDLSLGGPCVIPGPPPYVDTDDCGPMQIITITEVGASGPYVHRTGCESDCVGTIMLFTKVCLEGPGLVATIEVEVEAILGPGFHFNTPNSVEYQSSPFVDQLLRCGGLS